MQSKTGATSVYASLIVALGVVLCLSQWYLREHYDWFQTDASLMVEQFRSTVVLVQLLLLAMTYLKLHRAGTRLSAVPLFAAVIGFALSGVGWVRIDALMLHQAMLGC